MIYRSDGLKLLNMLSCCDMTGDTTVDDVVDEFYNQVIMMMGGFI